MFRYKTLSWKAGEDTKLNYRCFRSTGLSWWALELTIAAETSYRTVETVRGKVQDRWTMGVKYRVKSWLEKRR